MVSVFKSILRPLFCRYKFIRSKFFIGQLIKHNRTIKIEIGAGNRSGKNGWVTIDLTNKCDIYWDLRWGIPFPSESVSMIYSSHFLEHLNFKEGQNFLKECLRVLISGGVFSICVPDASIYINAYSHSDVLDKNQFFGYSSAYNHTTKIDYINYTAYLDGHHKYMFDMENLLYILEKVGFSKVKQRKFDPDIDIEERDYESIYAEAIK